MYGPKGVGALWVRRKPRVRIDPIIDGGGHERGMRSGTLAVPLIVGFGKAAELAKEEMARRGDPARARCATGCYRGITSKLPETLRQRLDGAERRLPGNLNISFAFVEGESLLMALKDVAVSSRLGVHVGVARAELRAARARRRRRAGALRRSASASAGSTPRRRSTT